MLPGDLELPLPGVLRYRRFMEPLACAELIDRAETANIWIQAPIGRYQNNELVESKVDKTLRDVEVCDLDELGVVFPTAEVDLLGSDIAARFDAPIDIMSRGMISKYGVGSHIRPHRDTGVYSTNRLVTCVIYLNDGYEGGALTFPQFDTSMSPAIGDCVCFYSEYLHGVDEITKGVRYCIVWFGESTHVTTR